LAKGLETSLKMSKWLIISQSGCMPGF